MHRVIKLLIIFSLLGSVFIWLNTRAKRDTDFASDSEAYIKYKVAEFEVAQPGNLEALTNLMGDFLHKAKHGDLTETKELRSFNNFWPDIVPVLVKENFAFREVKVGAHLQSQLVKFFPNSTAPEAEQIYQFLFVHNSREDSYKNLAKSLCFERLERLGCQLNFTSGEKLPNWAFCPSSKKPYKLDTGEKKLSCFVDHLAFTYPQRKILGQPEEIYRQLAMGYYNSERLHRLDKILLGNGPAAVQKGENVADIGCGVGCYTWSLAHGVSDNGSVYAQDIDKSVLDFVDFVRNVRNCRNVRICLGKRDDPKLPRESLDRLYLIDALNVMVGIDFQVHGEASAKAKQYLRQLAQSLRADGKIVVIDFLPYKNRPHLSKTQVSNLFTELGFENIGDQEATVEPSPMYALTFRRQTK